MASETQRAAYRELYQERISNRINRLPKANKARIQNAVRSEEGWKFRDGVLSLNGYVEDGGASEVSRFLEETEGPFILDICSVGGDLFTAVNIYNNLVRSKRVSMVRVNGIAASAASIIMLAAKKRVIEAGSVVMVHRAWQLMLGNAEELRKAAVDLDKLDKQMSEIYTAATGTGVAEEWMEIMSAETYFDPDEAVAAGLATEKVINVAEEFKYAEDEDEAEEDTSEDTDADTDTDTDQDEQPSEPEEDDTDADESSEEDKDEDEQANARQDVFYPIY